MPNVLIHGVDIYHEVSGDGPPLLFVNGSGSTTADVRPLIALFGQSFRVAVADSRGMGRTSVPTAPYTMADLASDAIRLLDHLGWDTCCVVGVSFGGMVSQEIAVTVPSRIRRLVLMCTSSGGVGGSSYPLQELARLAPEERAARSAQLMDTRLTPDWIAAHPKDRTLLDQMLQRRGAIQDIATRRGAELQLQARAGHDVFDRLALITSPTLVASGRFDGIAPPGNGAAIAARIPDAELRLYEGGHPFFLQDPKAMPDIIDFLHAGSAADQPER